MITVTSLACPAGDVIVRKRIRSGALVYEQGACCQSEADEAGISLSSYIHAIFSLIRQKRSQRVLMIGCGGGTLATLLARTGVQVTAVDTNPNAFHLARNYFQMPAQVRCIVADGAAYLEDCREMYDAVVLDAYNGDRIPEHLQSLRFLKLVKGRLDRSVGVFLANVYLHHDFDLSADQMIYTARKIWREAALLDARGHSSRNAIALAGAIDNLELPSLVVSPSTETIAIQFELSLLRFREGHLG